MEKFAKEHSSFVVVGAGRGVSAAVEGLNAYLAMVGMAGKSVETDSRFIFSP